MRRNPTSALLAASLIALAAAAGWIVWKSEFIRHPVTNGIAVLPFENLSRDPDNAYFAEGIQDEILTRLAGIADLRVISRTSTQQYQSKPRNLHEIAKQLGVANILEGSVQKAADQVRVNVQLINAHTDSHLWADTYDRKLTDILGVESDIAKELPMRCKQSFPQANPKPGLSADARRGSLRSFFERRVCVSPGRKPWTAEAYDRADGFYRQALARDPNFAEAAAELARSRLYAALVGFSFGASGIRGGEVDHRSRSGAGAKFTKRALGAGVILLLGPSPIREWR